MLIVKREKIMLTRNPAVNKSLNIVIKLTMSITNCSAIVFKEKLAVN